MSLLRWSDGRQVKVVVDVVVDRRAEKRLAVSPFLLTSSEEDDDDGDDDNKTSSLFLSSLS